MNSKPQKERKARPLRVIQFGEGNFLRAFVDYMIDISNEKGVFNSNITVVKPIDYGNFDRFEKQNNLYTVILRGVQEGQTVVDTQVVSSIEETIDPFTQFEKYQSLMEQKDYRFFVSNTTEAGIAFVDSDKFEDPLPSSFPGKVTKLLHQRYTIFSGDRSKGFIFLPVELIEKNGDNLKKCVNQYMDLWNLGEDFKIWVEKANIFCNTLVDRIVSGYPRQEEGELWDELGYRDELMVTGEPFGFWAIGSERIEEVQKELTLQSNVEVVFAKDIEPYKQRKVRILNGAHTSMIMGAYLYGKDIVEECMDDDVILNFMNACLYEEIIPHIKLDRDELNTFASSVVERFKNPFLNHKLLDISLNSTSKWQARVLPSFLDYFQITERLPKYLSFSFAAYIAFYRNLEKGEEGYFNTRNGVAYPVRDDQKVLEFYESLRGCDVETLVKKVMNNEDFWGQNLAGIEDFEETITAYLKDIEARGMKGAMISLMGD